MTESTATAGERVRVLVVEDEWLIGIGLTDELEQAGYDVIGPASSVAAALDLIEEHSPDLAVLDINLKGETSYPAARELAFRQIPFAFLSGYGSTEVDREFEDRPLLNKPVATVALLAQLGAMTSATRDVRS